MGEAKQRGDEFGGWDAKGTTRDSSKRDVEAAIRTYPNAHTTNLYRPHKTISRETMNFNYLTLRN